MQDKQEKARIGEQRDDPGRQGRYHFLLESGEAMDEAGLGAYLKRRADRAGAGSSSPSSGKDRTHPGTTK